MSVMAIAPVLQQVAVTLPYPEYYICQSPQGEWAITTLRHRQQPDLEIQAIYAFKRVEDIRIVDPEALTIGVAVKMPIVQILFDLIAFAQIDRVIFFNDSQQLKRGQEISRIDLETAIVWELQQSANPAQPNSILPPDIC
ncbi:MAG: hypothetical protein RLZZ135_1328 [Cyanobacteriota bacterium]